MAVCPFFAPEPRPLPADAPAVTRSDSTDETQGHEPPPPKRRASRWWLAAALLVLAAAVVLVVQLSGERKSDDPPKPDRKDDPKPGSQTTPPKALAVGDWKPAGEYRSTRTDPAYAVGFGPKGEVIAGRDGVARDGFDYGWWEMWPAGGGSPSWAGHPPGTVAYDKVLAVHPGGRFVLPRGFGRWNPAAGFARLEPLGTDLPKPVGWKAEGVEALGFGGNGACVVGGVFGGGNRQRAVAVWDAGTGAVKTAWLLKTDQEIDTVTADAKCDYVASITRDGVVRVQGMKSLPREWKTTPVKDGLSAVAITPDGRTVYAGDLGHPTEPGIHAWDVQNNERVRVLPCPWPPTALAVSPDGRWLAAGRGGLRVWDLRADPPAFTDLWPPQTVDLFSLTFSPDSGRLVAGGKAKAGGAEYVGGAWVWELKP